MGLHFFGMLLLGTLIRSFFYPSLSIILAVHWSTCSILLSTSLIALNCRKRPFCCLLIMPGLLNIVLVSLTDKFQMIFLLFLVSLWY